MSDIKPIFRSRIFRHDEGHRGCWIIQRTRKEPIYYTSQFPHVDPKGIEIPKEVFVKGKGWKKLLKSSQIGLVEALPKNSVHTYDDIFELIEKHGAEATIRLLGFDVNNYGDQYLCHELRLLEKHGRQMLDWLNKIALIDGHIKNFWETEYGVTFNSKWMEQGNKKDKTYNCSLGNPFISSCIEVALMGIIWKAEPSIDVISLDSKWKKLFCEFRHTGIENPAEHAKAVTKWYEDGTSMKQHLESMIGKELTEWFHDNLSPDFKKENATLA